MYKEERQNAIIDLIDHQGRMSVKDLADLFKVSLMTIRRDLRELEIRGLLKTSYGGALPVANVPLENINQIYARMKFRIEEKQKIAKYAGTLIKEGDTIFLDAGSTTLEMIPYLPTDPTLKVVTNSVTHALQLLERGIETMILGGTLKHTTNAIVGPTAVGKTEYAIKTAQAIRKEISLTAIGAAGSLARMPKVISA